MRLYFPVDLTGNLIMIEKLVLGEIWTGDLPIFNPDVILWDIGLWVWVGFLEKVINQHVKRGRKLFRGRIYEPNFKNNFGI